MRLAEPCKQVLLQPRLWWTEMANSVSVTYMTGYQASTMQNQGKQLYKAPWFTQP